MLDTHIFNKEKGILEPVDNKCMFCGKGYSRGKEDDTFVVLYKEQSRSDSGTYREVKFNELRVGVSRCESCKNKHKRAAKTSIIWGLSIAAAIIILFVIAGKLIIIGIIAAIVLGFFAQSRIEDSLIKKYRSISDQDAAMGYDIVKELVKTEGWTFDRPQA